MPPNRDSACSDTCLIFIGLKNLLVFSVCLIALIALLMSALSRVARPSIFMRPPFIFDPSVQKTARFQFHIHYNTWITYRLNHMISIFRRSEWISRGNVVTIVLALNQILAHICIFSRNALRYLYLGCSPSAERSFMKIDKRNFEIFRNFFRMGIIFA